MGPGRGRSRPERTRSAHPPSLDGALSTIHGGPTVRGPLPCQPPHPPMHARSSRPSGEAPGRPAGRRGLQRPDLCVCLSLSPHRRLCLSNHALSAVAPRWPSQAPRSRCGWPTTQGTLSATWTSQRTTSLATRRVRSLCTWRSCPMSKALPAQPPSLPAPLPGLALSVPGPGGRSGLVLRDAGRPQFLPPWRPSPPEGLPSHCPSWGQAGPLGLLEGGGLSPALGTMGRRPYGPSALHTLASLAPQARIPL